MISSAPARDRRAAARRSGQRLGADVALPRHAHRPPLRRAWSPPATRSAGPVQFSGLGMLSILTVDFNQGLQDGTVDLADGGRADRLRLADEPLHRDPAVGRTRCSRSPQLPGRADDRDRPVRRHQPRRDHLRRQRRGARLPAQPVLALGVRTATCGSRARAGRSGGGWQETPSRYVPPASSARATSRCSPSQGGLLVPVGQVSGLGQGEQIYSVRFVGDAGYVVTYQQVDPLYTIDLSTPTAPRVAGQLELEGYSAYLQPLGDRAPARDRARRLDRHQRADRRPDRAVRRLRSLARRG